MTGVAAAGGVAVLRTTLGGLRVDPGVGAATASEVLATSAADAIARNRRSTGVLSCDAAWGWYRRG